MSLRPVLAVIPARGGSKGLPGKNVRILAGLPLVVHSLLCARMSSAIDRVICSTDSESIADIVRGHGGDVPFVRPAALATDAAPIWPTIQHAVNEIERLEGHRYNSVVLLDPTSPGRLPSDIDEAVRLLSEDPACDGVIGVSVPEFNPIWHCVVEKDGYMRDLLSEATSFHRRQDVPIVYRINATVYCWRREFVDRSANWRNGRHRLLVVPDSRAVHIDNAEQFELTELRLRHGALRFPWLEER